MSRISDLRNNENNCVNLVKILELFCNGETKYVEMLLKLFKTSGDSIEVKVNAIAHRTGIEIEKIKQLNANEIEMLFYMVDNMMLLTHISVFQKFCDMNEQNQIENNDLHSYKTFDEVVKSVKTSEEKIRLKELEKQINKIYEDDDWLILIPQTYEASVKYGYNTKWCTASETTDMQFKSYTKDGILIYIIHKGVEKVAVYKKHSNDEISFWNQTDKKRDSFEFDFPPNIMKIIRDTITNYTKPLDDFDDDIWTPVTGSTMSIGIDPGMLGIIPAMLGSKSYTSISHPENDNLEEILKTKKSGLEELLETRSKTVEKWKETGLLEGIDVSGSLSSRGMAMPPDEYLTKQARESEEAFASIKPNIDRSLSMMGSPEFIAKVKTLMTKLR